MGDGNALMLRDGHPKSESTMRKGGQGRVTQRRDEEYGGYGATLLGSWTAGLLEAPDRDRYAKSMARVYDAAGSQLVRREE